MQSILTDGLLSSNGSYRRRGVLLGLVKDCRERDAVGDSVTPESMHLLSSQRYLIEPEVNSWQVFRAFSTASGFLSISSGLKIPRNINYLSI